jgi:hypothetical protein
MVVVEQEATRDTPQPGQTVRQRRISWPRPSQLRQSAPIISLLAAIWSIPQVSKIGLTMEQGDIHLWVVMPTEDVEAEDRVYDAEYDYANSTRTPHFDLDVIILDRMPSNSVPPFETVLER